MKPKDVLIKKRIKKMSKKLDLGKIFSDFTPAPVCNDCHGRYHQRNHYRQTN